MIDAEVKHGEAPAGHYCRPERGDKPRVYMHKPTVGGDAWLLWLVKT